MGKPAARISDLHSCPDHGGGPIITGQPDVLIGGLPAARLSDLAECPDSPPDTIAEGEPSVLIGGLPAAHIDHKMAHGGVIVSGCASVLIGDQCGNAEEAKAARFKCRMEQIAAAKDMLEQMPPGTERDALQAATDRFERNNMAVEYARLSASAYKPGEAPTGWNNISNDPEALAKYGLTPDDLKIPDSNFSAQVYEPDPAVFGDNMKPAVAFKGTQNMEDWGNNASQAFNADSPYYRQAVNIGSLVNRQGADVVFTGHSLGGGMASAASSASGLPGYTFNAAGLNANTVTHYGGAAHDSNISAYRVSGEILTALQEQSVGSTIVGALLGSIFGGLPGALAGALAKIGLSALLPDAVGTPFLLPGSGDPLARHGIDQAINGIEGQKAADQAVLAKATGKSCP